MCWEDLGSEKIGLLKMGLEELVLIDSVDSNVVLKPFIFFILEFKMWLGLAMASSTLPWLLLLGLVIVVVIDAIPESSILDGIDGWFSSLSEWEKTRASSGNVWPSFSNSELRTTMPSKAKHTFLCLVAFRVTTCQTHRHSTFSSVKVLLSIRTWVNDMLLIILLYVCGTFDKQLRTFEPLVRLLKKRN